MEILKIFQFDQGHTLLKFSYLVFISLVIILILLGIGLYIVYQDADMIEQHIKSEFNEQQLMLAKQAALQIEMEIKGIESELDFLIGNYQSGEKNEIENILKYAVENNREIGVVEAGIKFKEGLVKCIYNNFNLEFVHENIKFQLKNKILNQKYLTYYGNGGLASFSKYSTASGSSNNNVDTINVYLNCDAGRLVSNVVGEIRSGKSGFSWVVNDEANFLYHTEEEYIGKRVVKVFNDILSAHDFESIMLAMNNKMIYGKSGTTSYHSPIPNDNDKSVDILVAFAPVKLDVLPDGSCWSVALNTPVSEVLERVLGTTTRHIAAEIAIIISMFLLGGLIVIYERRMSRYLSRRVIEQQNYLSSILQYSVEAIIMMDKNNKILVWNKGAERIFGYTEKEMIGQTFHRIIPPELDANQELRKIHEEVTAQGYIRNYRALRLTADGRRITVDLSRTAINDDEGEIIGSVAIIKDITEEIAVEQRMYNTEKLASIGTLAAGVAHEINNPLAVILGFTDLLKDKFKEGSPELEDLNIIEQNAEIAKKTVENLLGFARVSEGEQESVNVNECLRTVINIVESTLAHKKIKLVYEIDKNLPDIKGDTREFQQVIFNLINNALAAMKGSEGTLKISGWIESRRVCVRVTDTGVGIPDRIKPRIFDPFFTTKKVGEGTGLGLSLCYGIIKKYSGSLDFFSHAVEDDPDEPSGSSFTVTMKIADSDKTEKGV